MLHYALVFLVVGLIAAALGLSGVAGVATQISWILFVIAIVLFIIHHQHVTTGFRFAAHRNKTFTQSAAGIARPIMGTCVYQSVS